jgi:hypothetical protein
MMFIHPDRVAGCIPTEWKQIATDAAAAVAAVIDDPDERRRLIESKGSVWKSLKPFLASLSAGKCWYCDSLEIRSDNNVDHFRPKGRLADDATHGGYWWLAFAAENYRFACTFCNSRRRDVMSGTSGGKEDRFPIMDEATRARNETDDLDQEYPLLLDPCNPRDVSLLWFDDAGETQPNPATVEGNDLVGRRVAMSRDIYHLDHVLIVQRRRQIYRRVSRLVKLADLVYQRMTDGDHAGRVTYEGLLIELSSLALPQAEHFLAARCALRGYRASSGAAQAVLEAI